MTPRKGPARSPTSSREPRPTRPDCSPTTRSRRWTTSSSATSDELKLAIDSHPPGATARLKILRRGEALEKTVELAKFPVSGEVIATNRPAPWRGLRVDYQSLSSATPFDLGVPNSRVLGGVTVAEVAPGSPADLAGLKKGQVITHISERRVRSPREFAAAAKGLSGPARLQTDPRPGDDQVTRRISI